jgi:hypothetical protein
MAGASFFIRRSAFVLVDFIAAEDVRSGAAIVKKHRLWRRFPEEEHKRRAFEDCGKQRCLALENPVDVGALGHQQLDHTQVGFVTAITCEGREQTVANLVALNSPSIRGRYPLMQALAIIIFTGKFSRLAVERGAVANKKLLNIQALQAFCHARSCS